ncbi:hypothetical protein OEV98_06175 [Caldibacillus lycopersici]|uniref:Uncharacterized protein n=1 Tax=Perspicuibacillus lycopersici TaxID=1325689 RepID=A0AAE3LMU1_9BACI|nr:hypothetical protein [Perspicuibacillus lycopersici]MCU9613137.1 hypothetical protein [Perspicuibacillus lycopersici]
MQVKELYYDCLITEEAILAHYIHHLLQEGKLSLEDDIAAINLEQANHEKVAEMIERNVLGIHRVRVYSLKKSKKCFVFIFAYSEKDAIHYFIQTFRSRPMNCIEYPLDFEFVRGKGTISFWELRREYEEFPAVAGYYVKN